MNGNLLDDNSAVSMQAYDASLKGWLVLLLGCGLLFFMGWQWNNPMAAWLAPIFLIRFFRAQTRLPVTLLAVPLMFLPLWLSIHNLWHLGLVLELLNALFRVLPLLLALYLDRFFAKRFSGALREMVFPSVWVIVDWFMTVIPMAGSVFSPAATQFSITPLIQVSSLTGIWGITFLIGWFATITNRLWENDFDIKAALRPIATFMAVFILVFSYGAIRTSYFRPAGETVRVGSVAIAFDNPYWAELKKGNPREGKEKNAPGFAKLVDRLFADSEKLAAQGAKIVQWGEANAPMYEDDEAAFVQRAKAFAVAHNIYLLPGMLVLHYDKAYGDNKVMLISPEGEALFSYEKTKTPKKTNSDAVLHYADTPFGRISAAVCFDMDYPVFVNQLGGKDIDIMLVPSWDNDKIKPFHTEVGAFRAVENGFSSVRNVVRGSSMAVDYQGNVLSYQDYFTVDDALMLSDIPVKGVKTVYGVLGDWLVYLCMIFLAGCFVLAFRKQKKSLA